MVYRTSSDDSCLCSSFIAKNPLRNNIRGRLGSALIVKPTPVEFNFQLSFANPRREQSGELLEEIYCEN